jgi:hypothetical protein
MKYASILRATVLSSVTSASSIIGLNVPSPAKADAAQSSVAAPLPEVTVTAPRPPTPQELAGNALPDFVHLHASPAVATGQLARWSVGICPLTSGLSPDFNDFVSARILAIAASVGAPHEMRGGCKRDGKHDVFILFSTDPAKTLAEAVKQDSRILGSHYPSQAQSVEKINSPIQGWYATASRGAYGGIAIDEAEPLLPVPRDVLGSGKHPAGMAGSRLGSSVHSEIYNALIVVDAKSILGHSIGSIADYIAMLTLTMASAPERCSTLPSILDMLLPNCADNEQLTGITAGDLAFLRALYKTDLELVLPLERSGIDESMMREFAVQ